MGNLLGLLKEVFEMGDQEINMEHKFRDYNIWDSLTHLSLIAMLDDKYNLQMEETEFKKIETFQDIFNKVNSKIS